MIHDFKEGGFIVRILIHTYTAIVANKQCKLSEMDLVFLQWNKWQESWNDFGSRQTKFKEMMKFVKDGFDKESRWDE